MDESVTRQAYIQLLIDILEKKKKLLIWLTNVTEQQKTIAETEPFDEQLFHQTLEIKEEHLKSLNQLDEGFEKTYAGVKQELGTNKEKYVAEIDVLKNLITEVTELSVSLQALEKRNRQKMEIVFLRKRKNIRDSRISSKTASNYYKTMANQHESESQFYDKKK